MQWSPPGPLPCGGNFKLARRIPVLDSQWSNTQAAIRKMLTCGYLRVPSQRGEGDGEGGALSEG